MTPVTQPAERAGTCRMCNAFCDKVVDPGACLAAGCPFLYAYDDELSGNRYVGCLHKVFRAEIELTALKRARRSGHGFGVLRATGRPLAACPVSIEPAFQPAG